MAERFEGGQVCNDPELFAFIEPLCLVSGSGDRHELEVQLHPKYLRHPCAAGCSLRVVVTYGSTLLADVRGATIGCDGCIRVAIIGTQQLPPGVLDVMLITIPHGAQEPPNPGTLIACTLLPILPAAAAEEVALLFEDMMMDADVSTTQHGKALPTASVLCEPAVSGILLSAASQTALSCCAAPAAAAAAAPHHHPGEQSSSDGSGPSTSSQQEQLQQERAPWFVDLTRAAVWTHHYQPLLADLRLALGPGVLRSGAQTLTLGSPTASACSDTTASGASSGSAGSSHEPGMSGTSTMEERSPHGSGSGVGAVQEELAACGSSSAPAAEDTHTARWTAMFLLLCQAEVLERLSQYFWENDLPACCVMVQNSSERALFCPSVGPAQADPALPHHQHQQQLLHGRHEQQAAEQPTSVATKDAGPPRTLSWQLGSSSAGGGKHQLLPCWLGAWVGAWRTAQRTAPVDAHGASRGPLSKAAEAGVRFGRAPSPAAICSIMLLLVAVCWCCFRWCMVSGEAPASCRPVMQYWAAELMSHLLLAASPSVLQYHRERLQAATALVPATLGLLLQHQGLLPVHVPHLHLGGWVNVLCFGLLYPYLREARFAMAALGACKWWLLGSQLPNLPATRLLLLVAYGSSSLLALLLDNCGRHAIMGPAARSKRPYVLQDAARKC